MMQNKCEGPEKKETRYYNLTLSGTLEVSCFGTSFVLS